MNVYWHLKNVPELSQVPREERRRRWRRVYPKTFHHWETWAGLLVLVAGISLGRHIGTSYGHTFIGGVIGGYFGGAVLWQTALYVARRHYSEVLRSDKGA
jgi:hypothetical protein